jgi:hypothetical protein
LKRDRTQTGIHSADRATVRESTDNIPKGSPWVRVQIVNVNSMAKKCALNVARAVFIKMDPLFARIGPVPEGVEPGFQ